MQFSDTTNKQGIVQDTYFEASANANSYPIEDVVRSSNTALDNVATLAIGADKTWQFDSTNATDIPIGTTRLVANQKDYTFDSTFLVVTSVECSDSTGLIWANLTPLENYDEPVSLSEFEKTSGQPKYYKKIGSSVLLYPASNFSRGPVDENDSETGGLRVHFERRVDYFTASDTTKQPGFALHLHKYIPLYNAYVYACAKELPAKQQSLRTRLNFYEGTELIGGNDKGAIAKHYSYRGVDVRRILKPNVENSH